MHRCVVSGVYVSKVKEMAGMFRSARAFNRQVCGPVWHDIKEFQSTFKRSSEPKKTQVRVIVLGTSQPLPNDRELKVRTSITTTAIITTIGNSMTCPRCGTFEKSGRVSCCAPGGAWYKNCGGFGNKNVDHRWIEGVEACKRKCKVNGMYSHSD